MSLVTLDDVQLTSLSPGRFPVVDTAGVLVDGDMQTAYIDEPCLFGVSSVWSDAQGEYVPQVSEISISGWKVDSAEEGLLSLSISSASGIKYVHLRRDPEGDILAQANWPTSSAPSLPGRVSLKPFGNYTLDATLTLASQDDATGIQVLLPFSSSEAIVAGDLDEVIGTLLISGVTRENSDLGILVWRFEEDSGDYRFTLEHGATVVAEALFSNTSLPDTFAVDEVGSSGITGTVTFSALSGYETHCEGIVLVQIARGVQVYKNARVEGTVAIGDSLTVIGNVSVDGNLSLSGDLALSGLAGTGYSFLPLAVDPEGSIVRENSPIQQMMAQTGTEFGSPPVYGEVVLLGPETSYTMRSGLSLLPLEWWEDGKRISIRMAWHWSRVSSETDLVVTLRLDGETDTVDLFSMNLPETGSDLSGFAILDLEVIASRNLYEIDTLELRGYYRMNAVTGTINLTGYALEGRVLAAVATYSEDDEGNVFALDAASVLLHERSRSFGT